MRAPLAAREGPQSLAQKMTIAQLPQLRSRERPERENSVDVVHQQQVKHVGFQYFQRAVALVPPRSRAVP